MGLGFCLVRRPQSEIVDKVRMNPIGRDRAKGLDVSGLPLASLTSFFANLNQRASIDMKHVYRSDHPRPRTTPGPTPSKE